MNAKQVCKDFLRMQKGAELDAMEASHLMVEVWDIRVDWHEMAEALDYLHRCGSADCTKLGGYQRYLIN